MKLRSLALVAAAVALLTFEAMPSAVAQQMGNEPYSFSRNPSLAAQMQWQGQLNGRSAAATQAGLSALQQYVTTYNSSSTSVGNLNEVTQILSGGSSGHVGQSTEQTSQGNQGSSASTDVDVDASVDLTSGDDTVVTVNNEQTPPSQQSTQSGGGQNVPQ